jgi:hypothetical protein
MATGSTNKAVSQMTRAFFYEHLPEYRQQLFRSVIGHSIVAMNRCVKGSLDYKGSAAHPNLFATCPYLLELTFSNGLVVNISGMDFMRSFCVHTANHTNIKYDSYGLFEDGDTLSVTDNRHNGAWQQVLNQPVHNIRLIQQGDTVRGIHFVFEGDTPGMILSHYLLKEGFGLSILSEQEAASMEDPTAVINIFPQAAEKNNPLKTTISKIIPLVKGKYDHTLIRYDILKSNIFIAQKPAGFNSNSIDTLKELLTLSETDPFLIPDPLFSVTEDGSIVLLEPVDIIDGGNQQFMQEVLRAIIHS